MAFLDFEVVQMAKSNPMLVITTIMLGVLGGGGGASIYAVKSYATEDYVDTAVEKVNANINKLSVTIEYTTVVNIQDSLSKEIFDLISLRDDHPNLFDPTRKKRLYQLQLKFESISEEVKELRTKLNSFN